MEEKSRGRSLATEDVADKALTFTQPLTLARRGIETRIVAGEAEPIHDDTLIRVLAGARSWAKALRGGTSIADLARATGHSEPYLRMRLPIAFLSPRLQELILAGRQPPDLTVARLVREHVPLDWAEQERRFGGLAGPRGA